MHQRKQTTLLRQPFSVVALIFAALTQLGCPGELLDRRSATGTSGRAEGGDSCPDVEVEIFSARCSSQVGCHGADYKQGMLDLETANVASRINGLAGTDSCSSMLLADPSDPASSLLYAKLLDAPPCGVRMPFGGDELTPFEVDCVAEYIAGLPDSGFTSGDGDDAGGE